MTRFTRRVAAAIAALVAPFAVPFHVATDAVAQPYPARPIRMVVPWTAGSQTDLLARMVGPKLADALGQQVVTDNRPGAGGTVGAAIVARATADGHARGLSRIGRMDFAPAIPPMAATEGRCCAVPHGASRSHPAAFMRPAS
jgi:tripartite-type tricarboxylate transporter receptor subunit TctC